MLVLETQNGKQEYPDISDTFFADVAQKVRRHTQTFGAGIEAPWALYRAISKSCATDSRRYCRMRRLVRWFDTACRVCVDAFRRYLAPDLSV